MLKIVFTKNATKSLQDIIDFLNHQWTQKEINNFKKEFDKFIQSVQDGIISYPTVEWDKNLRYALIGNKQVKVYFDLKLDCIEILLFFPSKSNPQQLKKLLK